MYVFNDLKILVSLRINAILFLFFFNFNLKKTAVSCLVLFNWSRLI